MKAKNDFEFLFTLIFPSYAVEKGLQMLESLQEFWTIKSD
jgi:hypothetical protein